jgi:hypothetical protein
MRHKDADEFHIPERYEFALPWVRISDSKEADRLALELSKEAPHLHDALPLAVARRIDNDDVLFNFLEPSAVRQGGFPFGIVHLSWSGKPEPQIGQKIGFFECWSHWVSEWDR